MGLIFHEILGHITVRHLDAALGKVAGETEILTGIAAGRAIVVGAGASDGGHDEITGLELGHTRTDFDYFPERLVTEHEVIRTVGRSSIRERTDLPVGAANA